MDADSYEANEGMKNVIQKHTHKNNSCKHILRTKNELSELCVCEWQSDVMRSSNIGRGSF